MANRRQANWRAVKLHRNYTVDDASRALGVSKVTVRRWLRKGLPSISERKPILILGSDLINFLRARRDRKQKCQLDECYCFSCRAPRRPAFNAAELISVTNTSGNLRALCEACATVMHKRVSVAKFEALRAILKITVVEAYEPIGNSKEACVGDYLGGEPKTHA